MKITTTVREVYRVFDTHDGVRVDDPDRAVRAIVECSVCREHFEFFYELESNVAWFVQEHATGHHLDDVMIDA